MEIVEAILTIDVPPHAAYNTNKFHWGCEFSPAINIFANSVGFYIWLNAVKSFEINSHLKQTSAPLSYRKQDSPIHLNSLSYPCRGCSIL